MIVNNTPKFLTSDPTDHMHALTIKDPDHPTQTVILPLALQGVTLLEEFAFHTCLYSNASVGRATG